MEFADKAWPGDEWSIAPTDKADVSFLKDKEREKERGSVMERNIERDGEKDKDRERWR